MASALRTFTQVSDNDALITLINSKQPKGNYLQITSQDIVPLASDVVTQGGTFN